MVRRRLDTRDILWKHAQETDKFPTEVPDMQKKDILHDNGIVLVNYLERERKQFYEVRYYVPTFSALHLLLIQLHHNLSSDRQPG